MQRIRQRRYGRDGTGPHATGASHIIKIGFDGRELLTQQQLQGRKDKGAHPIPGKLAGFLLCRDTLDQGNMLVVDMEAMRKYGATPESIKDAKQQQLKASAGLLPTALHFVLAADARREHGRWLYPGTFAEEYETWGKLGRFCHGDGVAASRRQDDGTRKEIECVPKGRDGKPAKEWCPYSVEGTCRAHSRLLLCLFHPNPKTQIPMPVSDSLGWEARFRFDTASEYNPIDFLAALDAAADRLHGNLAGIPGTLIFNIKRRRTGNDAAPVGIVGQVQMALSEREIAKRERELWERQLEQGRVDALPAHGTALPDRQIEEDAPAAEQDNDEPAVYVMGADETTEGATEPEPAGEASPEATGEGQGEPNLPAPATEGGGDLRARAQRAHDILLEHFPDAKAMVSFGLYEGYGARTLDEVKDDQLEKLIVEMREIYRNEKAEREGMRA